MPFGTLRIAKPLCSIRKMNVIPVKSVGYYIMLICVFMSCQDKTYEEPIDKSFREIKISVFDESLIKSMPQVELKLDDFQFSLASVNNTTICLELGNGERGTRTFSCIALKINN